MAPDLIDDPKLYEDLNDDESRLARRRLMATLLAAGADEEDVRAAAREGRLATLPLDFVLGGTRRYTLTEVARQARIDPKFLRQVLMSLGHPNPKPREKRIVGYPEIAMSVVTYSNAGDATAELVWVGAGVTDEDYAGKDVKGKFVLATGYGGAVHRLAVLKYGAAAVVCYLDDERAKEYPDMLQYTGMWPKPDELEATTFGFNLTNRQGEELRGLLEAPV